jgi:hypothetical protein
MKKYLVTLGLALSVSTASAVDFVSVDVENVKDSKTKAQSTAQYVRAGTNLNGYDLGLQVRTSVAHAGGLANSMEGTIGKKLGPVSVFTGVGHDNGLNGVRNGSFQYGVAGITTSVPVGPVIAYTGAKTRLNWDNAAPEQTLVFAGLSMPITKGLAVNAGLSKSYRDIKENAVGLGVRISF